MTRILFFEAIVFTCLSSSVLIFASSYSYPLLPLTGWYTETTIIFENSTVVNLSFGCQCFPSISHTLKTISVIKIPHFLEWTKYLLLPSWVYRLIPSTLAFNSDTHTMSHPFSMHSFTISPNLLL